MAERCRICLVDQGCMTNLQDERLEAKLKDLIRCTHIDVGPLFCISLVPSVKLHLIECLCLFTDQV